MNTELQKWIKKIEINNKENKSYTLSEVDNIADELLGVFGYRDKNKYIPVIKIVNELGFKTYKSRLDDGLSGYIYVNGETEKVYKRDKVIMVNEIDEIRHQRFVIAHELAHYLFDFLGNKDYANPKVQYSDTYHKNDHDRYNEKIANRFATELLMPKNIFIRQYYKAKECDRNPIFIVAYLSRFFGTTEESINKRIAEII